jgi:hypothetical protein
MAELVRIAEDVRNFYQRRAQHSWVRQGLRKEGDKVKIADFKARLDRILQRFGVGYSF